MFSDSFIYDVIFFLAYIPKLLIQSEKMKKEINIHILIQNSYH